MSSCVRLRDVLHLRDCAIRIKKNEEIYELLTIFLILQQPDEQLLIDRLIVIPKNHFYTFYIFIFSVISEVVNC